MPLIADRERIEEAEKELGKVIRKLKGWAKEIEGHHREIAKRNFAIGLEVAGFIDSFPPRSYFGMDLMGRIAEAVGFTPSYLSLLARISNWLYREKRIRAIGPYMDREGITNWSGVMNNFFAAQGIGSNRELSRRYYGCKSSLTNLKEALPRKDRPAIDRILGRIDRIVEARL